MTQPLHRRTVVYEAFVSGEDEIRVVGTFRDERPWSPDRPPGGVLHGMTLEVTVRPSDRTITTARATMSVFPHAECPVIEPAFGQLVGVSLRAGYGREVSRRFAGVQGCAHLHEVARGLGPAAVQALISWHSYHRPEGGEGQSTPSPGALNSCHLWAAGGIGEQKLAAGWRIGRETAYPVQPIAHFRDAD
ncbi:MAG TPA: DUF2889 domain-containing protein [Myxococcaceae bacterium]